MHVCIYPQINVLIRDVKGDYIVLQQSKYGIDGESYAGKLQHVLAMRQMHRQIGLIL
jgi:hypothetical protein